MKYLTGRGGVSPARYLVFIVPDIQRGMAGNIKKALKTCLDARFCRSQVKCHRPI